MKEIFYFLFIFILLSACSSKSDVEKSILYTNEDKVLIENFSRSLQDSINAGNYNSLTASWDLESFGLYFTYESRISQKILRYFFKDKINKAIGNYLLEIVDRIKKNNGYAKLLKIAHHGNYSEISFVYSFDHFVDFAIFKIKLKDKKAVISDVYSFRTSEWYSESLKKALNLNITYNIQTEERKLVNDAISGYKTSIESEEFKSAFYYLDSIPESHQTDLTKILKIEAAANLNINNYDELLINECNLTENVCLLNTYGTYFHDMEYKEEVNRRLKDLTGNCNELDSLRIESYIWNHLYPDPFALLSVYQVQFVL